MKSLGAAAFLALGVGFVAVGAAVIHRDMEGAPMKPFAIAGMLFLAMGPGLFLPRQAEAIPAFSRIYGLGCSECHSIVPALNSLGEGFRVSGYRKYGGVELTPTTPPLKISDYLELPGTVPLSVSVTTGYGFTGLRNTAGDGSKNADTSDDFRGTQSSFTLNSVEIQGGAPLGKYLSFFLDAPLASTESRQFFDSEVRQHGAKFTLHGPDVPELASVGFHDLLVSDLLNLKFGAIELPTAFSAEHRRVSFFPYLPYEATALDVIGRNGFDDVASVPGASADDLDANRFRLSNPQLGVQLFGRATSTFHHIGNLDVDYAVGVVNGNNVNTDNNKTKDIFGRLAATYTTPNTALKGGGFGYYSGNTLDNLTSNPDTGGRYQSRLWRAGPDISFTVLKPFYVNLFSQVLFAEDSNPTGFRTKARWWGGFAEADVKPWELLALYCRFDWINGRRFDDTAVVINGVNGTTGPVQPRLWDVVAGAQYFLWENVKLIAEYRRGEKDLRPSLADVTQLKKTTEDAVFAGVFLSF